ncbi:hypothetical protein [Parasphingorhabdus halotolerans]|uniref:Uncharacterized protein n=1 Tax=Parasphingorhabdus halotolerans TaxID=2725558 RepID=A0A6H2DJ15_9SPHN|nr:hypothetical protein [Parasphingorhabdus halotolerans]QJB68669.1 hypothetical protein HF685_04740 [Parasphingorhabdus halotolerans]
MSFSDTATIFVLAVGLLTGCAGSSDETKNKAASQPEADIQLAPIILLPNGLSQGGDHSFSYGADKEQLVVMLQRFGPVDQNANEECGAGPMDFVTLSSAGLSVNFQDDKIVGWFLDGTITTLKTEEGIGIGSTRAELEKAMTIEMQPDSTLGIEFYAPRPDGGFIGGFLTGDGMDAKVESLYAGTNCFFR